MTTENASPTAESAAPAVTRLRAVVQGHVQGVGYRYWAHHVAGEYNNLTGTVRNLPDGSVEVEAEAPDRATLERLFHDLHIGPAAAQVVAVDPIWEEQVTPRHQGETGLRVL